MKNKSGSRLDFKNPVIAAQVMESPFVFDSFIGHTMPPGKDFIGESNYINIEVMISDIKKSNKKIILNIGDSSTSGWDSNIVTLNKKRAASEEPLLPAFFQYKTYSDCLRDLIADDFIVINAGVPAHTSLQGFRRLQVLLDRFKKEAISIDWVTIYYGNNDSVWDHSRQDNEWVGETKLIRFFKSVFLFSKKKNIQSIITRVPSEEYKKYMGKIISLCKKEAIKIIVIKPLTPIYWKPGTRVLGEDLERIASPGAQVIYKLLDEARELWQEAYNTSEFSLLKKTALETAREKDYIVPRIKKLHSEALDNIIKEQDVPYVDIQLDRSRDDIFYFIDYCHPIETANQLIAKELSQIVKNIKTGKEIKVAKKEELELKTESKKLDIPTDHYTLY